MTHSNNINWHDRVQALQHQASDARLKHFYSQVITSGTTPISHINMVAMDFETTGLDSNDNDIVSMGLVPFNLNRIFCRQARHWLLKPTTPLDEQSVVLHQITHAEVADAPRFDKVITELLTVLAGSVVVVHYHQLERAFLRNKIQQVLGDTLLFPLIDTMELEFRALDARRGLLGKLFGAPIGSTRLTDSRKRYGLPVYNQHHALTDALATAELLQAQLAHHYRRDTPLQDLWM
ncbi:3'-5' exonuclease [Neiella marina]|uniref:3'-5' exonuclease n=1 Tax=Neiella holothuriorum TaxID=2870530 RepID=A0ABS7EE42_9GAMM|nr:3'-5' exonuclease [Neiella holothuriorum]MBW8190591.1 3'-5' exonuclease [Neiella holothuriorum]